ncbi:MAG: patatin family protein [Treponema sp.]|nr:patatin family protein [Treponema sp.]
MKYGLVLEGGSRKGLYTAGILDVFMEQGFHFDYIIGVSAGSHAALNYVTGQKGRLKQVLSPESIRQKTHKNGALWRDGILKEMHFMIYKYSFDRKNPFDFKKFFTSDVQCEIGATCADTGIPVYWCDQESAVAKKKLPISRIRRNRLLLDHVCASCSLPILFPPVKIGDKHYADGCVTDSVPFERAFEQGCDKLVVITTQEPWDGPTDFKKWDLLLSPMYKRKWPNLYNALMTRYENYCKQEKRLAELEQEGKALVFHPVEVLCGLFENSAEKINESYDYGVRSANARLKEVKKFLGIDA